MPTRRAPAMTAEWRQRTKLIHKALTNAMRLPPVAAAFQNAVTTMDLLIGSRGDTRNVERQLRADLAVLTDEIRSRSPVLARTWGSDLGAFLEAWAAWRSFEDRGEPERAREAFALRAPAKMAGVLDVPALRGMLGVPTPRGRPAGSGETPDSFAAKLALAYTSARREAGARPTQDRVAAKLGFNTRTLRKWLDDSGIDWREFVAQPTR